VTGIVLSVLALFLLALIPATIAATKGKSFVQWYIFGVLLLIVVIPAAVGSTGGCG
jgi:hypothetical protein